MPTGYPGSIDSWSNPGPTTKQNASGLEHDVLHSNANDAIEAIEGELGTTPSGDYATVKARLDDIDVTKIIVSATQPDDPPGSPAATWIWLET